MNIVVLGASGGTGREVVRQAENRGWNVKAQVRRINPIDSWQKGTSVLVGDPLDKQFVQQLVTGADAVIVALGIARKTRSPFAPLTSPTDLTSQSVANVLAAMQKGAVRRIIYISAFGAGDSWRMIPWWGRLFVRLSNVRYSIDDHTRSESLMVASALDWTALRPMMLAEGDRDASAKRMQPGDSLMVKVPKSALAKFALDTVNDLTSLRKAVPVTCAD